MVSRAEPPWPECRARVLWRDPHPGLGLLRSPSPRGRGGGKDSGGVSANRIKVFAELFSKSDRFLPLYQGSESVTPGGFRDAVLV